MFTKSKKQQVINNIAQVSAVIVVAILLATVASIKAPKADQEQCLYWESDAAELTTYMESIYPMYYWEDPAFWDDNIKDMHDEQHLIVESAHKI